MTRFNTNNFRLFLKTLVTAWVPFLVITGIVTWSSEVSVMAMGASTLTIDAFFRVFGVSDDTPLPN